MILIASARLQVPVVIVAVMLAVGFSRLVAFVSRGCGCSTPLKPPLQLVVAALSVYSLLILPNVGVDARPLPSRPVVFGVDRRLVALARRYLP